MKKLLPRQYAVILYDLTHDMKGDDVNSATNEFVTLLYKHQMLSKADDIIVEFISLVKEKNGIHELFVTSAHGLDGKTLKKITALFGDKVEVQQTIDPSLVGGIKIRYGNTIFDASVVTQLEKLHTHLK